ncbi:MAG: D-alanine--D-alanine ligase [Candidatus Omnitrophica bacterium]|nr:D-alanine--D-alanine ligase [Candidatus Omnitrophota bacterium]
MLQGLRVGVLMGGPSAEREISLQSGQAVAAALRERHHVIPIDVPNDPELLQAIDAQWMPAGNILSEPVGKTAGRVEGLERAPRALAAVVAELRAAQLDVAFIALHGPFGEDGTMQLLLEQLGVPYTGSGVRPSQRAMDKVISRVIFDREGLRVPQYHVVTARTAGSLRLTIPPPVVVKPVSQGSSIGVTLVDRADTLPEALSLAFRYDPRVLIEEFIPGREVTVGILGDQALPVVEICPKRAFFDFAAKYQAGETGYEVPAKLEETVTFAAQETALRAHRVLGCRHVSRVDMILREGRIPVILELNTIPGFTATSLVPKAAQAAGLTFEALCERLVELALQEHPQEPAGSASESRQRM